MENNKPKRFYKVGEMIWVISEKKEGKVKFIDKKDKKVTVTIKEGKDIKEVILDLWDIDKLKYKAKEKFVANRSNNNKKVTYFSSVNGGVIPTKDVENAGRDCYARFEPKIIDGKEVYELFIKRLTLAKIPLGFASYLNVDDLLSLKHERSSIGSTGIINVSGLIDSTYQGEVILQVVPLTHDIIISSEVDEKYFDEKLNAWFIPYSKAIAQAVVLKQSEAKDVHIPYDELLKKPSSRGTGGWGSSGK
ncbi:deoxyuridine 5'-triphosphate nucleotidohydrolase [Bacillus phage vB_BcoS-136]|uniref:Deoxyuridine 5'-triphosphate nucleotidohydrolase n=1 Tax=Bacillus phage vB_BcoS-136 TaxID=2419619 RepID=A0A3G3BW43_9CAUD|nr:deoxyuridine 5'-triphosphate nucleotidohydrolase [Bacillus phage vB_BcoS-136]AYP68316.1 deoxyuridine 5'-triphosphate nucleotidohydrolase [Bacillus phage vB_BcoS-136]